MTIQEVEKLDLVGEEKPKGRRGSFFAQFNGELLPCVFERWKNGEHYLDPGAKPSWRRWAKYFAAIRDGQKVILTTQKVLENGLFKRTGYKAIYSVSECRMSEDGLEFSFGPLLTDLS
jgi:hypothetical protein